MRVRPYSLCATLLIAVGVGACIGSLRLSSHGFSGYDVSPMIDAGWRVLQGQVPGRDFVVTFPPSLYGLTALSFRLFGVTWHAIALGACLVFALLLLLGLRVGTLLRRSLGDRVAVQMALAFAAGQIILLVSINYLWHAALAESFGIYAVFATLAVLSAESSVHRRVRLEALLHLTLACACLLLSKPNTAFPVILLCLWVLIRGGLARAGAVLLVVAALLASLALAGAHTTPWAMLWTYAGLGGRLIPKAFFNGILFAVYARYGLANLLVYAILAPACWAAAETIWSGGSGARRPAVLLGAGSMLVGALGMGTNFDFKLTDTPLVVMGLAVLSVSALSSRALRFRTLVASGTLLLLALYFGRTRLRMQIIGSWADDKCPAQVTFDDRFLGRFTACPVVPETLAEVDATLAASSAKRIFFGPGLEFLYAARAIPSPLHLPNWWDPGSSYPLRKTAQVTGAWKDDRFDLLILAKDEDRAQLTPGIAEDLEQHYVPVPGMKWIHVFRLR